MKIFQIKQVALIVALIGVFGSISAKSLDEQLYDAARKGQTAQVQQLIQKGANVNVTHGAVQSTPLIVAAFNLHLDVVRELLKAGANVNATTKDNTSALIMAMSNTKKGNVNAQAKRNVVNTLVNTYHANVNQMDRHHRTALKLAIMQQNQSLVRTLVTAHADVNAASPDGSTPLQLAKQRKNKTIVQILEQAGAH